MPRGVDEVLIDECTDSKMSVMKNVDAVDMYEGFMYFTKEKMCDTSPFKNLKYLQRRWLLMECLPKDN